MELNILYPHLVDSHTAMSHPQGPVSGENFNRDPKRESYDVIIDSSNRDKVLYPESNDFRIPLPICPLKNIRNIGIFFMTLVKTETTIHGDKLGDNGKTLPEYSPGNQLLRFNEGIRIHNGNRIARFKVGDRNVAVSLPKTTQEVCADKVSLVNDRIVVVTPNPHNYMLGQVLQLFGYPYIPDCADYAGCTDPNTEYEVIEITGPNTVYLLPLDHRFSLGNVCDGLTPNPDAELCALGPCDSPRLLLGPLQGQEDLAQLVQDTYNTTHAGDGIEITITWNPDEGVYVVENNANIPAFVAPVLLGDGNESYTATVSTGNYTPDGLATALQTALNQPTVVLDENDEFAFREMNSATVHTVKLPPGTYTPETLAIEIAAQMNAALDIVNEYEVCYDQSLACFRIAGSMMAFELQFADFPGTAELLGFVPLNQGGALSYASQHRVYFPVGKGDGSKLKPFFRSNNRYQVHYDATNKQYTILLNGQPENSLVSVTPLEDSGSIAKTTHPHGLDIDDIVFVTNPPVGGPFAIATGLYIVECVISATEVRLNMAVCGGTPGMEIGLPAGTIFGSIPLPFNIDFAQPRSGMLELLGMVPASKQDQTWYRSTRNCISCQPLYLLVQIPEFIHSRLWAQYQLDGPPQKFFARLDADFDERTYELTNVPETILESLFIGTTIQLDKITVRIIKPDGALYDTARCDWSMWLRFVIEH